MGGMKNNNHSGVMNTERGNTVNINFMTLIGTPPRLRVSGSRRFDRYSYIVQREPRPTEMVRLV